MDLRPIKSLIEVLSLKLKYKSRVNISAKQNIEGKLNACLRELGNIEIGDCGNFRNGTMLLSEGKLVIGKHFFCNQNVSITCLNEIIIGDYVEIANNVVIVDHDHDFRSQRHGGYTVGKVHIGNNVWIGANSIILKNTVIKDNAVIAAGSVVKGTVKAGHIFIQKRTSQQLPIEVEVYNNDNSTR